MEGRVDLQWVNDTINLVGANVPGGQLHGTQSGGVDPEKITRPFDQAGNQEQGYDDDRPLTGCEQQNGAQSPIAFVKGLEMQTAEASSSISAAFRPR